MLPSRNDVVSVSCLNPRTIVNRHYALMEPADRHQYTDCVDYFITIPCGRCRLCKSKWAKEWKVRLHYELQACPRHLHQGKSVAKCMFLTLTLNNDYVTDDEKIFANWLIHFRDNYRKRYGSSPRYFATTDRGSQFGRLHLHMLLFNPDCSVNELNKRMKSWYKMGFYDIIWIYSGLVDEYLTGYLSGVNNFKDEPVKHGKPICDKALRYKPRVFVSKGLGRDCVDKDLILSRDDNMIDINGFLYTLPRYYRNKWYSDTQRYYQGLINTMHCDYISSLYEYNYEKSLYRINGKIVEYKTLQALMEDARRFDSPEKERIVTDWDSALEEVLYNEESQRIFYDSYKDYLDPLAETYHGLLTYYSEAYWDRLTQNYPY